MSAVPRLEVRGVTRTLPGPPPFTLVRGIDLAIAPGEFVSITGPSGSGKSSLLYLLGLLDVPSAGEVLIDGRSTAGLSAEEIAGLRLARLGFVFQFHFLLPEFTARENILIPMRRLGRWPASDMRARADRLLAELGMSGQENKRPDQMSGGQRQRVAIARALANDPAVLLADEPTGNLDTRNAHTVFEIFRGLAARGTAVVVVTHEVELASMADRRVHLIDGEVAAIPA